MTPQRPPDRPRRRAIVAWSVAGAALLVVYGTGLASLPSGRISDPVFLGIALLLTTNLLVVGATLAVRRPENPIGVLLLASGVGAAVSSSGESYVLVDGALGRGTLPLLVPFAWVADWAFAPTIATVGIIVPLLYPTGRPLGPRWRWVVAGAVAMAIGIAAESAFAPGFIGGEDLENPFVLPAPWATLIDLLGSAMGVAPIFFALAVVSVAIRFRQGSPVERAQLKWFALVAGVVAVGFLPAILGIQPIADIGWTAGFVALAFVPVAIGLAIVRYRLYEIDRIVSRTLAYGALTAVLAGVYLATFASVGAMLTSITGGGTIPVAISTLAVFALFQPARRRIQDAMDRRFDRSRYDAARTVAAFAGRVRNAVDPDGLAGELVATATASVRPSIASVWLRRRNDFRTPRA